MDFLSFDNGFKQLCVEVFMQECGTEEAITQDYRLLSLGKLVMPNRDPQDIFFYPSLYIQQILII